MITPKKAIKLRCKDCLFDDSLKELCKNCELNNNLLTNLKKIRKYCLWCCNGQKNEVELCPSLECSLYQYRFGKNTNLKGNVNAFKNILNIA
jgi:hypothetical protein